MAVKIKYLFIHGDEPGMVYESDIFGLVVIFNGILKFGEPFYIHNSKGEDVEGEEKRDLIEALTGVMTESVNNAK